MKVEFESPPVTEVVIGLQFRRLPDLNASLVGDLHKVFAADYPKYQERPPLEPIIEDFGPRPHPQIRFQLTDFPGLPRLWFVNEHGEHLVQIQQDRFICNWRRTSESAVYPRFHNCYATFCDNLQKFREFLSANQIRPLNPSLVELLYVNHFPTTSAEGEELKYSDVLALFAENADSPRPEEVQLSAVYPILDADRRVGRIHASFSKQIHKSSGQQVFELRLNCRGIPLSPDLEGVKSFLELAHEGENRVFLSLTSQRLHKEWGKQ